MHVTIKGTFVEDRAATPWQRPQQCLAGYRGAQSCTKGKTGPCAELVLAAMPWTSVGMLKGFSFPGIL